MQKCQKAYNSTVKLMHPNCLLELDEDTAIVFLKSFGESQEEYMYMYYKTGFSEPIVTPSELHKILVYTLIGLRNTFCFSHDDN